MSSLAKCGIVQHAQKADTESGFVSLVLAKLCSLFNQRLRLRYASKMDILKMLSDLREEREQIGEAIIVLERLAARSGKRRGRPPAWMADVKDKPTRRGRPPGSKNKS
jgi:hypothetical protein